MRSFASLMSDSRSNSHEINVSDSDRIAGHRRAHRPYSRLVVISVIALTLLIMALWLLGTPAHLMDKVDAIGYAVCHRIPSRSFAIDGRPLPLCARCTGIYLGVMTALGLYTATGRLPAAKLPPIRVLAVLLLFGGLIAIDGLNSYLSIFSFYTPIYQPHNTLRLLTGIGAGITMLTIVLPVFNSVVWRAPRAQAPLTSLRETAVVLVIGLLVAALVLLEIPALLLPLALLSVFGVLLMFWIVGTVLFLTVMRRENTVEHWHDLQIPGLAGFAFAMLVIGTIDLARYALTGTWEGFTVLG